MGETKRLVYLMRGLPSCGKSHTAQELAGSGGVVLETDAYFLSEVGDDPAHYDYREDLLEDAREWNLRRFDQALSRGVSPIVVDRGNGLNQETKNYVDRAQMANYQVELREPTSLWWQELRVLLKYKKFVNGRVFDMWADQLAERSLESHRVPASTIRRWMSSWKFDLTIQDIVEFQSTPG